MEKQNGGNCVIVLKKCGCCNLEFPRTHEYFYGRSEKRKNPFQSNCKSCSIRLKNDRRIKKRCEELGCDVSDYKATWTKKFSEETRRYKRDGTLSKFHVDNLTDRYIKSLYYPIKVPEELIETRRLIIKLKRGLKNGK